MPDPSHKLAAIMFTDIVGYSTLVSNDAHDAFEKVNQVIYLQSRLVEEYKGIWIKEMGDGTLSQFESALDAVNCAVEIQKNISRSGNLKLRIGIHLGEITLEGNDVFGEGVIIASRLESIATPGGVYLSEDIANAIHGISKLELKYLGKTRLKNVNLSTGIYAIQGEGLPPALPIKKRKVKKLYLGLASLVVIVLGFFLFINTYRSGKGNPVPFNKEMKIAVLPFENQNNDSTIQYVIDGLYRVIVSNLTSVSALRVTPSQSVEKFKGTRLSPKEIAEEIGADYLLTASFGNKNDKLTGFIQLIDPADDNILWSEIYENDLVQIVDLERKVSFTVIDELKAGITEPEKEIINKTLDTDPLAQKWIFKAWEFSKWEEATPERLAWAREYAKKALAIDSTYALGWFTLARIESFFYRLGFKIDSAQKSLVKQTFIKAELYGSDLEEGQWVRFAYLYFIGEYEDALLIEDKFVAKYPDNYVYNNWSGLVNRRLGNYEVAEERFKKALELDPTDAAVWYNLGQLQARLRKYDEAKNSFIKAIETNPLYGASYQELAQVQIDLNGDLEYADSIISVPQVRNNFQKAQFNYQISLLKRDFKLALKWIYESGSLFRIRNINYPGILCKAYTYYIFGNDSSRFFFNQAFLSMKDSLLHAPDDYSTLYGLGLIYAGIGEYDNARQCINNLVRLRNTTKSKLRVNGIEEMLIDLYIMVKDYHAAMDLIENHIKGPYWSADYGSCTVNDLKLHPQYDPLRKLPEFRALMNY